MVKCGFPISFVDTIVWAKMKMLGPWTIAEDGFNSETHNKWSLRVFYWRITLITYAF